MKTWKKLYRVTWTESMKETDLISAVKDAFPDARPTWKADTESRTLYIRDGEGEEHYILGIYCLNKTAIQQVMDSFEENYVDNPLFYKVKSEGATQERLRDTANWWPDIDTEEGESAVLDTQSLHLTIIRHIGDSVDPLKSKIFATSDEQVGKLFRALRNVAVGLVNNDVWKDVLFDTGCEMIAVSEEHKLCPSDW